jgi:nicotinate phosphoribosyltransferase
MKNFSITGIYTDLYQLTMAQVYFLRGNVYEDAVFDYFFRKLPFDGGYVVFAGLSDIIQILQELEFTTDDIDYLKGIGLDKKFAESLRNFRFRGSIYSVREGEVVFPNEPILRVEGNMIEAQLVETVLLNVLNFESLIATKAARIRSVAGNKHLSDFGLRRAQGLGGYHATRAAIIGGFDSTSNVKAAQDFNIPPVGTMAHSFVQSHDDELTAFREFALNRSEHCVLLVDTYDTLRSGVPNAIKVAKEMQTRGHRLQGVRLDSGDLAYLSKETRKMLDAEGLTDVKITVSNQLDEWVIKSLLDQQAPIDVFGVGTNLVTGAPDAALDGVYKLSFANGKPRIKLSENLKKITLPDKKQVLRILNEDKTFFGADVICLHEETRASTIYHPTDIDKSIDVQSRNQEPLLQLQMQNGKAIQNFTLKDVSKYAQERLTLLPAEHKRFDYPHTYKIGLSQRLRNERDQLKKSYKL